MDEENVDVLVLILDERCRLKGRVSGHDHIEQDALISLYSDESKKELMIDGWGNVLFSLYFFSSFSPLFFLSLFSCGGGVVVL